MRVSPAAGAAFVILSVLATIICAGVLPAYAQTEARLRSIRVEVDRIDLEQAKLRSEKKDLDGISVSAEGRWYLSQNKLRKMVAVIRGKTGASENEYYYSDDNLIFAHHRWTKFDRPAEEGPTRAKQIQITTAYFEAGKCISLTVDGKPIAEGTEEWTEALGSVLATSSLFKSRMANP
jgi:hypothetical protein